MNTNAHNLYMNNIFIIDLIRAKNKWTTVITNVHFATLDRPELVEELRLYYDIHVGKRDCGVKSYGE